MWSSIKKCYWSKIVEKHIVVSRPLGTNFLLENTAIALQEPHYNNKRRWLQGLNHLSETQMTDYLHQRVLAKTRDPC